MEVLGQLTIARRRGGAPPATLELLRGDLARLPPEHEVDALVVSAFPNSYTPDRGTLFEALWNRGLDMQTVSRHKAEDQRPLLGCWLSRPIRDRRRLHIGRIVCFEPRYPAFLRQTGFDNPSIEETVGFVFRCLNNFAIPDAKRQLHIRRVAMPLLATGNQGVPVEVMLPRLLDAAIFWLEEGLPVERLKIVAHTPQHADVARGVFAAVALSRDAAAAPTTPGARPVDAWPSQLATSVLQQLVTSCTQHVRDRLRAVADADERRVIDAVLARLDHGSWHPEGTSPPPLTVHPAEYDVFVSYAHEQDRQVRQFVDALRQARPDLRVFHDRSSIPAGGSWIKLISDAVQKTRVFVAVLSPDYFASPVCWDEFQCAKLKEYNTRASGIITVRLYRTDALPPIFGIYSYIDCVQGNLTKLRDAATTVAHRTLHAPRRTAAARRR